MFVNRQAALALLEVWWGEPGGRLGAVWGPSARGQDGASRRVRRDRRAVFHTVARRPGDEELRLLSAAAAGALPDGGLRDLGERPFVDWRDALDTLSEAARDEPLLVVLDEFPDLVAVQPGLPGELRAFWDRARTRT